jgi:hypothetical protein
VADDSREGRGPDARGLAESLRAIGAWTAPRVDGYDFEIRGVAGRFVLGERDDPSDAALIHCRVPVTDGAPRLAIELRPQTPREQCALDRGEAIDVELGDEAFDRAFVVEVAPLEVVRPLLDEPTRAALLALAPCRFALDAGDLHLSKSATRIDPPVVALIVGVCVGVGERVDRLRLDGSMLRGAAAYRDAAPVPTRSSDDEARAQAELEAVAGVRRTRRQSSGANAGLVLLGVVVVGWMLDMLSHR